MGVNLVAQSDVGSQRENTVKGSQHLFSLALTSESVTRMAYHTDAFAVAGVASLSEPNMVRLLEACDTLASIVAEIRAAREVQS